MNKVTNNFETENNVKLSEFEDFDKTEEGAQTKEEVEEWLDHWFAKDYI